MKVVLICHFSNSEIQDIINPNKPIQEFAPWIPMFVRIYENIENIELHVISPHEYLSIKKSFKLRGVFYHFYNAHIPVWGRHWPGFFKWDYLSNFRENKKKTKRLVNKIKPDIIHLFGAENAYYSSTILQFRDKYPVLISVQGFIHKSSNIKDKQGLNRINLEMQIIKKFNNHAVHTNTLGEQIKNINKNANLFRVNYPIRLPNEYTVKKKYDLVFFARISMNKGIFDLLEALKTLKNDSPDIKLCVIGNGAIKEAKHYAYQLGIEENVTWAGFLPTQHDVHKLASQAKISVLPTYHDIISGTIIESLFLKIPVVAYNVGSIHEINEKAEIISLVEKIDIEGLAKAIKFLLDNPEIQKERSELGYQRAKEMFVHSDEEIRGSLLNSYCKVINEFSSP